MNVEIRELGVPSPTAPPGVVTPQTPGAVIPRVLREVKPRYTVDAMARKIEGTVSMSVIVEPDGTVGSIAVLRSLDPDYGLDQSAREALAQWKFRPATLNAEPVRMPVTVSLTFTLK